jgi:two-component system nitrogen regulation response regulator GlnG
LIAEVDQVVLAEVLRHVGDNQVHASQLLGISRTTLRSKLQLCP